MNEKIAVLEDEQDIRDLIALHLKKNGFRCETFSSAEAFFRVVEKEHFQLLLLDLILPDMNGTEVCRKIKSDPVIMALPIIMVTAKTEETDKIVGLELGADDYITKPFSPKELIARVKAVLRRSSAQDKGKTLNIGKTIVVDPQKHEVFVSGKKVELTFAEFGILSILASRKGWVFSREKIIDELWEGEKAVIERSVDVHVKNLRDKLGGAKKYIKNVRGVGYKIEE